MDGIEPRSSRSVADGRGDAARKRAGISRAAERVSSDVESRIHVWLYRGNDGESRSIETGCDSAGKAVYQDFPVEHDPLSPGVGSGRRFIYWKRIFRKDWDSRAVSGRRRILSRTALLNIF